MEFKNDFKSYNFKYKKDEGFGSGYKFGSGSLERLETRVPDDDNECPSQFTLKNYLSQIKSLRISKDFDFNPNKNDTTVTANGPETTKTKPLNKQERFQRLEKSLSGIQSNVELKRSSILEDIYQKINNLENKITDSQLCSSKNFDSITKRIETIEKNIDLVNKKHENVLREKADAIDNICEKFHNSLANEQESWGSWEKTIISSVNEQINSVKDEISDMQRVKSEVISNMKGYIEVEMPRFKSKIESANKEIKTMEDKVLKNISEDLILLASFIKDEHDKMTDFKDKVMTDLNSEIGSLRFDIRQECEEREVTQKRLIGLMEETIKRLESPL